MERGAQARQRMNVLRYSIGNDGALTSMAVTGTHTVTVA